MPARHHAPDNGLTDPAPRSRPSSRMRALAAILQTWADTGYGLWALQGTALAFGVFRAGRGESLVPLALGALFVSAGLLLASLRLPGAPAWHGWHPGRGVWPTREALIVLVGYLPMLAVAGLTRGNNDFWATRLAGAGLMVFSLGNLMYSAHGRRKRLRRLLQRASATLPISRVIAALYAGGLWLWLCASADRSVAAATAPAGQPWLLLLLVMALLLGLLEGMRWHALRAPGMPVPETRRGALTRARFLSALLSYAIPCVALLLAERWQGGALLALLAALGSVIGRSLEQRLYEQALARCAKWLPAS